MGSIEGIKLINLLEPRMPKWTQQIYKSLMPINKNDNGYKSEDDDIKLQQILFYSSQFHSGKNLE
ncbi:hypothetical protein H5410_015180 [Solanum commersonii]|uniref:Uncharacterized protein n=1 Tax=Solanum commersonii TaxID=4109 RepID=A0A9J5ZTN5_SOLCO|nr:hypothetical protein H5410_015180 [Solanum commersonii]